MLNSTLLARHGPLLRIAAAIVLVACESKNASLPAEGQSAAVTEAAPVAPANPAATEMTLVTDASQVCMVNDQFMGQPQIPVNVKGKTYYGCCAMCKGRLQSDASTRTASDPFSHEPVDKATAVIGRLPDGATLYFANRENFDSYSQRAHHP